MCKYLQASLLIVSPLLLSGCFLVDRAYEPRPPLIVLRYGLPYGHAAAGANTAQRASGALARSRRWRFRNRAASQPQRL